MNSKKYCNWCSHVFDCHGKNIKNFGDFIIVGLVPACKKFEVFNENFHKKSNRPIYSK